jgi:putative endonuclease
MKEHRYWVYIITNPTHTVLYIGVTSNIHARIEQHKEGAVEGFTKKYNCKKLIYTEETDYIHAALAREKQLKGWTRKKKENLITSLNPEWKELDV